MIFIKMALLMLYHPIDCFNVIKKRRNRFHWIPVAIIFILFFFIRMLFIYQVHYPVADILPQDANIVLECVKLFAPVLTWILALYGCSSILDGESTFTEIITATAYCFLPYIVFMTPLAYLSKILCQNENGLFLFLKFAVFAWTIILIFLSVKILNDYSFGKTFFICLLGIIFMAIMAVIALLVYALTSQLVVFVKNLMQEIRLALMK